MLNTIRCPSPNFNERPFDPRMVILHYTDLRTTREALQLLTNPSSKVSAHYLIDKTGGIYDLVSIKDRAWHAGVSYWKGETDINSLSIGIELSNPGHSNGYEPFPFEQISSLLRLLTYITDAFNIQRTEVWAHSDIAPLRKKDPGELFPWEYLGKKGFGVWPHKTSSMGQEHIGTHQTPQEKLRKIGYGPLDLFEEEKSFSKVIKAFQRHFCSHHITGEMDRETLKTLDTVICAL